MSNDPADKKGKRMSLGRMLGAKKDKDASSPPPNPPQHLRRASDDAAAAPAPVPDVDSAYVSNSSSLASRPSDIVNVENTGQYSGVSRDRSLTLNKKTGDVVDTDSGEVVSTVVTTTTTTTTTTTKINSDGKRQAVEVHTVPGDPSSVEIQELPADTPRRSPPLHIGPAPAPPASLAPPARPPIPHTHTGPDVPTRDPRRSADARVSPVEPQTNFSYPNCRPPPATAVPAADYYPLSDDARRKPPRTMDNLKAAALGLHVGPPPTIPPITKLTDRPGRRRNPARHHQRLRRHAAPAAPQPRQSRRRARQKPGRARPRPPRNRRPAAPQGRDPAASGHASGACGAAAAAASAVPARAGPRGRGAGACGARGPARVAGGGE